MTEAVLALIGHGGRWFLQRRDPGNPVLPGLWEFPGGKVEEGETLGRRWSGSFARRPASRFERQVLASLSTGRRGFMPSWWRPKVIPARS